MQYEAIQLMEYFTEAKTQESNNCVNTGSIERNCHEFRYAITTRS